MSTLTNKQILLLFQSNRWTEIYHDIKEIEYDDTQPVDTQFKLAVKAMLLTSLWFDNVYSEEILKHFHSIPTEPLIHFMITYANMCLGNKEKTDYYITRKPKDYPKWMGNYLTIEYLGRSYQYKNQINLIKKIIPKNKKPDNYILTALLQSLERANPNLIYLTQWLKDINLISEKEPLTIALCIKANLINIEEVDVKDNIILLAIKARKQNDSEVIEALKSYDRLVSLGGLNKSIIHPWLSLSMTIPQGREYILERVNSIINFVPTSLTVQGTIASYAMINAWINGDYTMAYNISTKYYKYQDLPDNVFISNTKTFLIYIFKLCLHWEKNKVLYNKESVNNKILNVIGESHSLSLSNINISIDNKSYQTKVNFISGIKMYHLSDLSGYYANSLRENLKFIPLNADLLFTIGEIDTRPDEGMWKVYLKKNLDINEIINKTINVYIDFLFNILIDKKPNKIIIQGVPAPNYNLIGAKDPGDKVAFLNMIKKVNEKLKELTLKQGWNFLDVYSATVNEEGTSNKKWHIDGYHLQPLFYTQADKWLIKPEPKKQEPVTIDFSKPLQFNLSKPS